MNLLCLYLFPALPFSFFTFSLLLCAHKLQKARRVISVSIFSFASPDVIWSAESQLEPCKRSLALSLEILKRQMILQDHVRHVLLFAAAETLSNQLVSRPVYFFFVETLRLSLVQAVHQGSRTYPTVYSQVSLHEFEKYW